MKLETFTLILLLFLLPFCKSFSVRNPDSSTHHRYRTDVVDHFIEFDGSGGSGDHSGDEPSSTATTPTITTTTELTTTIDETTTSHSDATTPSETSTVTKDATTPSETSTVTKDATTPITSAVTTSESTTGTEKTTTTKPATCQDFICAKNSYCVHGTDGKPECPCYPGFYPATDGVGCIESSQFGGTFVFTTSTVRNRRIVRDASDDDKTRNFVKEFVYEANDGTEGFIDVYVDEHPIPTEKEEWNYKTIFDRTAGITSEIVQNNMEEFVNETCDDTGCVVGGEKMMVDTTSTIINAIGNDAAACMENTCDKTSTNCTVNSFGTISCRCKSDAFKQVPGSIIYCEATLCTSNSHCNYPFGECLVGVNNGIGMCQCMTTFSGENCENPWLFVFVVSVPLMIIVILLVVAIHIIKKKRRKIVKEEEEKKKIPVKEVPALMFPAYPSLRARLDKHLDPTSQNENDSINLETFDMFVEKVPDRLPKHSTSAQDDRIERKARNDNLPSQRTNQKERKSSNLRGYQNPSYL